MAKIKHLVSVLKTREVATAGLATAMVLVLIPLSGCHRQYYRKQADNEAHGLIREKSSHIARPPASPVRIEVDRRSRMFTPFDLDFQPMPLDDPAAHRYMQCVDGRRGYPMWHAAGTTNTPESPDWYEFLPLDENGVLVLNADNSVRLALLHSPDFQRQTEQLFLSALDVSSERFRFDTQFFGGAQAFWTSDGDLRPGGGGQASTRLAVGPNSVGRRDLAMQRAFATGADLVVGVANSIVWELSGPNSQSASTVLDFALLQPLLRGAGRDRVLERLTLSERNLLANVRAFERYRRSFYLNVTTGRNIESTVQRSGGVFGVGLGGFTGLGGGFAGLGGGFGAVGISGGAGIPQAGGFIGLLQDQLQIQNLEENIARLGENLLILENTLVELLTTIPDDPEEIIRQRLQVAQARSALLSAQTQLVSRQAAYQGSLDSFLRTLGLPPYICVRIEDPMLERFELIDTKLRSRRQQLINVRSLVGGINVQLLEQATMEPNPETGLPESRLDWTPEVQRSIATLQEEISPLVDFNQTLISEDLPRVLADIARFEELLSERQVQNESLLRLYREELASDCTLLNLGKVDEAVFDIGGLSALVAELKDNYDQLSERLGSYTENLEELKQTIENYLTAGPGTDSPQEIARNLREDVILKSQDLLASLGDDVLALQLIQAQARTEGVLLPEVQIDPREALEIARRNRRDWANARASLVNSWRLIEFNANDLESSLNVVFSGDVQNVGSNPLDLRSNTGRLRVGLQWDAPITRLQERNTYRQSLIEFEQAKRNYYAFEDSVWQLLRGQIRQLQANRVNFELGRQAVRIAALQLGLNEDIRGFRDARGLSSGPTAARDTISALTDLLNSQNALLNIFVNFEVVRRGLNFDMGIMELTPEGIWLDPGPLSPTQPWNFGDGLDMVDCGCTDCGLPLERLPVEPTYSDWRNSHHSLSSGEGWIEAPLPPPSETILEHPPERLESIDGPPVEVPQVGPASGGRPASGSLGNPLGSPMIEELPAAAGRGAHSL